MFIQVYPGRSCPSIWRTDERVKAEDNILPEAILMHASSYLSPLLSHRQPNPGHEAENPYIRSTG